MSRPLLREHAAGRVRAVAGAARAWRDPDHDARAEAVQQTLDAPGRFTTEALAFAVNAATHALSAAERMRAWLGERSAPAGTHVVAVAPSEEGGPLVGLRAALAAFLAGHRVVFRAPGASPALVPAFMQAARQRADEEGPAFATAPALPEALEQADAAIGGGDEEARASFEARCAEAQVPPERRRWRGPAFAVAVLDGHESDDEREELAEDALLYDGWGRRSVRLVWAPAGTDPDPYFQAMARFRAVFPVHEDTPGALQMQKAFLEARDEPHAHGDGLEFLVSRGAPQVQPPGHVRWVEYDALGEVQGWLARHAARDGDPSVQAVLAREDVRERLDGVPAPAWPLGTAHRHVLEAPGEGVLDFAAGL
ncbi:MAG: hypothetical protein BRD48_04205 [Bacteroidetes bacterium QS_9_68_14]|nr:MAG: hypothetical protein BRD48_04205 [Bacteroidetes bacterium QS_9_68_14]